jgi:hypothetical protein
MPEPHVEPGEHHPGGVDALDPDSGPIAIPDLSPEDNPAIEERAPDALQEGEDTSTKATRDADDDEPEKESPA